MQQIREQMESIAESVVRLSEQGQMIGEIMLSVNDLAEQSNLLAMRASSSEHFNDCTLTKSLKATA